MRVFVRVLLVAFSSQILIVGTAGADRWQGVANASRPAPQAIADASRQHEASLHAPGFLQALYEARDWAPIWTDRQATDDLLRALSASESDGLLAGELRRQGPEDPFDKYASLTPAERELLLSDTLIALGDRLVNGRADPRGLALQDGRPRDWVNPESASLRVAVDYLDAGDVRGLVEAMRPSSDLYRRLRLALMRELAGTRDARNVSDLRVNLERARWFERALGDRDRVVVNIPAFSLDLHINGEAVWQTRVIVGKTDRRTPVFVSEMRDVVLDPTWTVPRSIIEERLYDEGRTDPQAFAARGFRLRDASGHWHSPVDVDWARYASDEFPFDVVQMPGSNNALGRVKFLFDNPYAVYLHDTPSRGLFDQASRAFSHGCVRVQHPEELEQRVLEHFGELDAEAIASLRADADNVPVDLLEPLMVGLLYWTIDVDQHGQLVRFEDIYDRDALIRDGITHIAAPKPLIRGS